MRVFITGATGFVGLNIAHALLAAGHEVACFVRPGARRRYLERLPLHITTGTLDDQAALAHAMHGTEAVIHTAGNTSSKSGDLTALQAANIDSTRAILQAARTCGVRRIVYTSTTSTIGSFGSPRLSANESVRLEGWRARSPYAQTKQAAEALLLSAHGGPECVVLNPAEVIGPYDHTLQWGRMVLAVAAGQLPFIPPGSGTFCPASAVAKAHLAALTLGRPGERYILGGHNLPFAELISQIGMVTGQPIVPHDTRPYPRQCRHARQQERLHQPVALDSFRMRMFGSHHLFDDSKACAELGYAAPPLHTAIDECYSWYLSNGFLDGLSPRSAIRPPYPERTAS